MNLLRGLTVAVLALALLLGLSLGSNQRPDALDAQTAKREAAATAAKQARIASRKDAYNKGLEEGMVKGRKAGRQKAEQELGTNDAEPTGATGATTDNAQSAPTGATGR